MSLTRVQSVFNEFSNTMNSNPWLYRGIIFLAFIGTATALGQKQGIVDMFSKEGFADSISPDYLQEMGRNILKSSSVESVCNELNGYLEMCKFLSADFVTVEGGMEVSDCSAGDSLGQSSNPVAMVCNSANLMMKMLPQEVLDTCAEMAKNVVGKMGM